MNIKTNVLILREIRKARGLSAQSVAETLHISKTTLLRLERRPDSMLPSIALALAAIYSVSIDDLDFTCAKNV
ncbi:MULTISPECIES: helix-turn-helix transcriptional regulator [unclassified Paenibacillus]|uniref:helix-turn-helix transcriptional regulator n=1 Tax=unclassified Paenibacillus TaxID=185978 RepID=UPI0009710B75|nr:helix-turn-helix transcriptional regulator [Paenibacillus sp. RUD330]